MSSHFPAAKKYFGFTHSIPENISASNPSGYEAKIMIDFFSRSGEWLLMIPRPTSLTAGFVQRLRYIARTSSTPMLPNTVLTRSQLGMAEPGFEPTALWLDIWSGFELHFWPHKSARTDPTDPLQLSVRSVLRLSARAHTSLNSLSHPQISASH